MTSLRRRTSRGARAAAALASLALGGVALFAGTASAATTGGAAGAAAGAMSPAAGQVFAVVRPAGVAAGSTEERHTCAVIHRVADATEESVHCADVWFKHVSTISNEVWASNEVFCQNLAGKLADCPSISEKIQLTSAQFKTQTQSGACGTRLGHSDCRVRKVENSAAGIDLNPFLTTKCTFRSVATDTVTTNDGHTVQGVVTTPAFTTNC
jgi:hypothetical protein